jgi:hypothetical protein
VRSNPPVLRGLHFVKSPILMGVVTLRDVLADSAYLLHQGLLENVALTEPDVECVLADIDADDNNCILEGIFHGVLLVLAPLPGFYCWRGGSTDHPISGHSPGHNQGHELGRWLSGAVSYRACLATLQ